MTDEEFLGYYKQALAARSILPTTGVLSEVEADFIGEFKDEIEFIFKILQDEADCDSMNAGLFDWAWRHCQHRFVWHKLENSILFWEV